MAKKKTKKKKKEVKKSPESQTQTIKNMLLHLEDEYRKANISEKSYKELKEKYTKKINELTGDSNNPKSNPPTKPTDKTKSKEEPEKKKGGFLKKIFGRKEKEKEESKKEEKEKPKKEERLEPGEIKEITPEVIEKLSQQMAGDQGVSEEDIEAEEPEVLREPEEAAEEQGTSGLAESKFRVELEKVKVMIDTIRESKRITDETIQTISESIGEMRSMIFQTDATLKENMVKMEKIEDDVAEVRPQDIVKKFRDTEGKLERINLDIEKLQTKSTSQGERLNEVLEMIKSLGGVENLLDLNKKIQERLNDVKEAEKYIERIGNKIEKIYIDLNRGLEDLVLLNAKQEDFDGTLKDVAKTIDSINVKFGNYITKKDMDSFRKEIILIQKQLEQLNKVIPIAELKIPESIISLRKEREDIKAFLESVEEQFRKKEITKEEYESIKSGNMKKLKDMEKKLKEEWDRFEKTIKLPEKKAAIEEQPPEAEPEEKPKEEGKVFERPEKLIEPSEAKAEDLGPPPEEPEKKEKKEVKEEEKKPKKKKVKPKAKPEKKAEEEKVEEVKEEKPAPKPKAKAKVEVKPKPKVEKKVKKKPKKRKAKPKKVKKEEKPKPKKRRVTETQRKKKILRGLLR